MNRSFKDRFGGLFLRMLEAAAVICKRIEIMEPAP